MDTVSDALMLSAVAYPTLFLVVALFWGLILILRKATVKGEQ